MVFRYWNALVVFIGTFSLQKRLFAPYDPLYCIKQKRVLAREEIPSPLEALCRAIALEHGIVKCAFENHPPHPMICEYKKDFIDRSEAYLVTLTYHYTADERALLAKNIVGITYYQSYSSCGQATFGWHETLYE
ncbi:MAG: hypothetical protein WA080_04005 [Sulfuricurvum sp.]